MKFNFITAHHALFYNYKSAVPESNIKVFHGHEVPRELEFRYCFNSFKNSRGYTA